MRNDSTNSMQRHRYNLFYQNNIFVFIFCVLSHIIPIPPPVPFLQLIFCQSFLTAKDGQAWHPHHYCCWKCGQTLDTPCQH